MDLETMQTVYMVAVTGSFSLTAEMIPCSQPTISRRIKMAEDELGVQIFDRHSNHKQATLTAEGRQIVSKFAQITKDYNELLAALKSKQAGAVMSSVALGIAGNTMITSPGIDLMYSDFLNAYPNADFSIVKETEENVVNLLSLGKINYGLFVRYTWNNAAPFIHYYMMDAKYRVLNFAKYGLSIAVSENSELGGKSSITMNELEDVPFVYSDNIRNLPANTIPTNHFVFFEACRLAGFTTKIITLQQSRAVRTQAVVSGRGSTHCALPERLRAYSGIKYLNVSDAPIHAEFFLISSKEQNEKQFNKVADWLKSYFVAE